MQIPASRATPLAGGQDEADAQFEHAGCTITVTAFQDENGVWLPRVTVDTGPRRFEIRELAQPWRGWRTRGEAVRDGMEQARQLLSRDRHQP